MNLNSNQRRRIIGAVIKISDDAEGSKVRWSSTFDDEQESYTFAPTLSSVDNPFQPQFDFAALAATTTLKGTKTTQCALEGNPDSTPNQLDTFGDPSASPGAGQPPLIAFAIGRQGGSATGGCFGAPGYAEADYDVTLGTLSTTNMASDIQMTAFTVMPAAVPATSFSAGGTILYFKPSEGNQDSRSGRSTALRLHW